MGRPLLRSQSEYTSVLPVCRGLSGATFAAAAADAEKRAAGSGRAWPVMCLAASVSTTSSAFLVVAVRSISSVSRIHSGIVLRLTSTCCWVSAEWIQWKRPTRRCSIGMLRQRWHILSRSLLCAQRWHRCGQQSSCSCRSVSKASHFTSQRRGGSAMHSLGVRTMHSDETMPGCRNLVIALASTCRK